MESKATLPIVDDVEECEKAEQKNREFIEKLSSVIEHVPGGMCLYSYDKNGIHPLVHNKAFFEIFGYSDENIQSVKNKTAFLGVHPDDLDELKNKINKSILDSTPVTHTYRAYNDKKATYIWVKLSAIVIDQGDGSKLCYVSYTDITEEKETQQNLLEAKNTMQTIRSESEKLLDEYKTLVNTVPGGIALFTIENNQIKMSFVSDGFCRLLGYSIEERDEIFREDPFALTYQEDIPLLKKHIRQSLENKSDIDLVYRILKKCGEPLYVRLKATYLKKANGIPEYHAVFSDVDRTKKLEKINEEQQIRYEVTVKSAGINIWEYDIINDKLTVISSSSRIKQNCFTIENYVKTTVENDYVRKDSIPAFYHLYKKLKEGVKEITEDIWYKTTEKAGWWCERVIYTTVFDEDGKPIKAFGAGRDVTHEKETFRRFQNEMSYRTVLQGGSLASLRVNLTQNKIIDINSQFEVVKDMVNCKNVDEYFTKTANFILKNNFKEEFLEKFNRHSLINDYYKNKYSVKMEFTRTFDTNKIFWVDFTVYLMKNPGSKDIIALIVTKDKTTEKVMEIVMRTVSNTDYDFFTVVDGSTNSAVDYANNENQRLFYEDEPFEERNEELIRKYVCKEDVERVIQNCKIKNVLNKIKNGNVYRFNFSMQKDGEIHRKQLQFTMIDYDRQAYLMTRVDVNEIYLEQQLSQQQLKKALKAAESAAEAKTDFLSRMSHDIRTPLNAVIGLSDLGSSSDSLEEMREYLKQIGLSGKYLLSIINDVLDMSKITSKSMVLRPTVVFLPQFINDTVAIVRPTLNEKHIKFELTQKGITSMYMRLDATHVRQVTVNLLSNAAKFTPENGHIVLSLENISRTDTVVKNRMTVRDNGIGMSKEFLPKIFVPFEQENTQDDGARVGTGLGLAIVKSIIDLMGGTIRVESEKGKGSAFIIEWEFETVNENEIKSVSSNSNSVNENLCGKRILLCEDHPLNAKIATKLLEKKEVIIEHANNGKIGVEMFKNSEIGYYDAVLMDIRMPVMDGLTASKNIRALKRKDAKTVPIIAMTANAFEEDIEQSMKAGMNAHLSKPIEPQKLYEELSSKISQRPKS